MKYELKVMKSADNTDLFVNCEDVVRTMLAMFNNLRDRGEELEKRLGRADVYKKDYLRRLELDIAYNKGFADALHAVAFMCGDDFYFHEDHDGVGTIRRDPEAFSELVDGIEKAPVWLKDHFAEFQ